MAAVAKALEHETMCRAAPHESIGISRFQPVMQWKLIANCETVKSKCEMKKSWLEIQKSNHAIIFKFISMVFIPPTIGQKMTPRETTWVKKVA